MTDGNPAGRRGASGFGLISGGASRFTRHSEALRERHGDRVWRVGIDGGFSCPNRRDGRGGGGCSYCSSSGARAPYLSGGAAPSGIGEQVAAAASFLKRRYGARLFFLYFQAFSSTYAPVEELKRRYDEALALARGLIEIRGLVVSTRPDCIDEKVAALLASYAEQGLELWVELGLQSSHDRSLARVGRGHCYGDFLQARTLLGEAGLRTAVHLILGLPGENREDILETLRRVASLGVEGVKFHDLYIPRDSRMAAEYLAGELVLIPRERLPSLLVDCLELLPPDCEIIRLCADSEAVDRLAPRRVPDKTVLYRDVEAELASRDSFQGRLFRPLEG